MKINLSNSQRKFSAEQISSMLPIWNDIFEKVMSYDFIPSLIAKYSENIYVNLNIVGKDRIHEINNEFRSTDKATDVISFPMLEMSNGNLLQDISPCDVEHDENGEVLLCLGDVIICPEVASKNAEDYGHSFEREMAFLFAHSILHLLGFDHMNSEDEVLMIANQKRIMCDIGMAFDDEIEFVSHLDEIPSNIVHKAGDPCEHVGYVAIIGRPNVGKSTLLNYITGMKLAIVSHKPQTTRTNIRSIYNGNDSQVIFVDTPGVHNPKSQLSKIMVENSFNSAKHADLVLMMVDGRFDKPASVEKKLLELCTEYKKKVILAINKSDDISKEQLLPTILSYSNLFEFDEIIPISAKSGDNVEELLNQIEKRLPAGPRLFDSEYMTNQTEREIAAELIREQILHYTNQEIPHGTTVVIDQFKEKFKPNAVDEYDREMVVIHASIVCERKSHKGILLGKDGQMIKRLSTQSRINIERLTGCKVYLELFVKVREDWKNDDTYLKQYGYFVEEDN